jgi:hypothetical protein
MRGLSAKADGPGFTVFGIDQAVLLQNRPYDLPEELPNENDQESVTKLP